MRNVWKRKGSRLILGECRQVMSGLIAKGELFDAVICDPPYSSGGTAIAQRQARTSSKYQSSDAKKVHPDFLGDNRDQRSYLAWSTMWLSQCRQLLKPGGMLCVFIDWRQYPVMSDALQAADFLWKGGMAWNKGQARPAMGGFDQRCEFVLWGTAGKRERQGNNGHGAFTLPIVHHKYRVHAAEKPVELLKQLCQCVEHVPGGRVLDPFAGSGTTIVAARELGLDAVGIEQSPEIAAIAKTRLEKT